jgi:hypothetical protein
LITGRATIAGRMKVAFRAALLTLVVVVAQDFGLATPVASGQDRTPGTPNPDGSTAIEQALIEHACRSQLPGIAGADAYQECLDARLRSLRADFGRDLSQVSAVDRKALDAACSNTRQAEGREAYLECLTLQLVSIRNRRSDANAGGSQETPLLFPSDPPQNGQSANLVIPESATASSRLPLWIGVALVALAVGAGGAFMAVKGRRQTRNCHVCGAEVPEGGDLCSKCRHEAAETLRHAAAERADRERTLVEEQRRQGEREEELRRRRAREEEDARLRQEMEARQRDDARQREEEAARQQKKEDAESRRASGAAAVSAEDLFDPYVILGVPRGAGKEAIDAACQAGRLKYAPEHVAHLGPELQEHYKRKADAVERACQILSK